MTEDSRFQFFDVGFHGDRPLLRLVEFGHEEKFDSLPSARAMGEIGV